MPCCQGLAAERSLSFARCRVQGPLTMAKKTRDLIPLALTRVALDFTNEAEGSSMTWPPQCHRCALPPPVLSVQGVGANL